MTGKVMWIKTVTSLHAGCGSAMGAIDLPVQRERHTNWPLIPSSSLKGVFRDAQRQAGDKPLENRLYGSEDAKSLSAGALSFTDARLLAFPVRSLVGTFAWVSCPMALQRWSRDSLLVGKQAAPFTKEVNEGQALVSADSILVHKNQVILEEFALKSEAADLSACSFLNAAERKRLVIVGDDQFSWFCEFATETVARIGLEQGSKTVKKGALFYQELVPPETVFYALLSAGASQGNGEKVSAEANLASFQHPDYLQFGGDESTGRGLCHVS